MTTFPDDLGLRVATADDYDALHRVLEAAFGEELTEQDALVNRAVFEPERTLLGTDGGTTVAGAGAFTRDLTVPGAVLPAAHVSLVGVHPLYRRRGLLTRMMRRQLTEITEPVAVLWASEGTIYQRFGYGCAARRLNLRADTRRVRFLPRIPPGDGVLREADPAQARTALAAVYERVRRARVGWSSRPDPWWDKVLSDPPEHRGGATARRVLLHEGPDGVDGYALWRTTADQDDDGPAGRTEVRELAAATPQAYTRLWRFLLSLDLSRTLRFWAATWDEPLFSLVEEPRLLGGRQSDALWVRVTDVPAALAGRRYQAPLDTVLEVTDDLLPGNTGRWRLRTAGGPDATVDCTPSTRSADLALDVADLGAVYLGGTGLASLVAGGRVRELAPGALAAAAAAFGWPVQPGATEVF